MLSRTLVATLDKLKKAKIFFRVAEACRTKSDNCSFLVNLPEMVTMSLKNLQGKRPPDNFLEKCKTVVDNFLKKEGKKRVFESAKNGALTVFKVLVHGKD